MNQLAILLIACGVVIAGCSEWGDNTDAVPTLYLVLDSKNWSESPHYSCVGMVRNVEIECHVQSDRPVERDTYVLVNAKEGNFEEAGKVGIFDCTTYGEGCERLLIAILAGETQSQRLSLRAREWDVYSNAVPKIVVTLPPAHERAAFLPRQISYTGARGQTIEKDLLVEYPFNPYNVGSPMEVRFEWRESEQIDGSRNNNEFSEMHELNGINQLLNRWRTAYENEDVDAYISFFSPGEFLYVSDMGTPDDTTDDVKFDNIREERESAIRVFSLYQNIQIEFVNPPEVKFDESRTRAEVRIHYEITGFVRDGVTLKGGHDSWYTEGVFIFVLQRVLNRGGCQWRITRWFDKAINKERVDKIATQFANVKLQ